MKAVCLHPSAPLWIEKECKTLMIFNEKIGQTNWLKSRKKLVNELVKQLVRRPQKIGHKIGRQIGRHESQGISYGCDGHISSATELQYFFSMK